MTDKLTDILDALKLTIENSGLGFFAVYIGDETLIPEVPAVSVLAGPKSRQLVETGHTTMNTFDAVLVVWHAGLQSQNVNRRESTVLAEQLEDHIHQDKQLGGLVFSSHCTSIEPGFSEMGQQIMVTTRISWQGRSKTRI